MTLNISKLILIQLTLFTFFSVSTKGVLAAELCSDIYLTPTLLLDQKQRKEVLEKPFSFLNKKFDEKTNHRYYGTPFTVVSRKKLPKHLQTPIDDIHLLSTYENLRNDVFGNARRTDEYQTKLLPTPLHLQKSKKLRYEGFFVETGVEVFTLNTGERLYIYTTSNSANSIQVPYGFLSELISEIKTTGRTVVALDSFHTHPMNLLPSVDDRVHFKNEFAIVRENHPEIDLTHWRIRTTMDTESVLHEVQAKDWYSK